MWSELIYDYSWSMLRSVQTLVKSLKTLGAIYTVFKSKCRILCFFLKYWSIMDRAEKLFLHWREFQKCCLAVLLLYLAWSIQTLGFPGLFRPWASHVAQSIKNLPAMLETWVRFLGQEDPLEKEMATHSSILAWKIPGTEEAGRLQSIGLQELYTASHYLSPFIFFQTLIPS